MTTFPDRREAGRRLGAALAGRGLPGPVVIALPRGGVPVGAEVARALGAPLEILVARKVGAPGNPELAIGAVAPGVVHSEPGTIRTLGVSEDWFDRAVAREQEEVRRREGHYRQGRPALPVSGMTVILVDDGLATGATAAAAIASLRRQGPAAIVLAVPVGTAEALRQLRPLVDAAECLEVPAHFHAVGQFYRDFRPTTDAEVMEILAGQTVRRSDGQAVEWTDGSVTGGEGRDPRGGAPSRPAV